MPVEKYVVKFSNENVDAGNYQLVDFDFDTAQAATVPETVARIVAYLAYCGSVNIMATGTFIESISYRAPGDPGGTDQPFPSAGYTALVAAAAADMVTLAAMTDGYGSEMGGDALCPLGTSISVSERSETVGRTGRGRHFLPFISRACVTAAGAVSATVLGNIVAAYHWFLLPLGGTYVTWEGDTIPTITNHLGTSNNPIVLVKPQPIFSNLETRRR